MIDPAGPAAARIATLSDAMTLLGAVIFVIFGGVLLYALLHRRTGEPGAATPDADRRASRRIVLWGGIVPAVVLVPLFAWTVGALRALDPRHRPPDLVVEVSGRQWWWQLRYAPLDPARTFIAANEIVVPVGRRVEIRLTSADVNHSFWVPALNGKTDLIPGRRNVTWIEATRPGVFRGQCAEYCGIQHAHMAIPVIAVAPTEFERWATRQREPAEEPSDSLAHLGRAVFLASACAACHAVRGTDAGGTLGPDLTHMASRRTLAAGAVPNTPGHLAGWIANPQGVKPGTRMPRVPLSPGELEQIRYYLMTLD